MSEVHDNASIECHVTITCYTHHIGLHEKNVVEISALLFKYGFLQHRCHFLTYNYETVTACYITMVIFDRCRYHVVKTTFFSSVHMYLRI